MSDLPSRRYTSVDNVTVVKTPTSPSFPRHGVSTEQHHHPSPSSVISSRITEDDAAPDHLLDQGQVPRSKPPLSIARHEKGQHGSWATRPGTTTPTNSRVPWSSTSPRKTEGSPGGQRYSTQGSVTYSRPASRTATHVPSIAQPAFFRPMSSQRLQAQRGMRSPTKEIYSGKIMSRSRNSMRIDNEPPPPSRGTDTTELTDDGRPSNGSPLRGRFGSLTDSVRPLQRSAHQTNSRGLTLNLNDASHRQDVLGELPATKSPRSPKSFSSRLSFTIPTRTNASNNGNREMQGREKLSSRSSSVLPGSAQEAPEEVPEAPFSSTKAGRNHQYFGGNTRFWAGGRFQNARGKPLNIITGILVILPGVLFFVFSAPWLWYNVSPAIPVVFAYIYYICVSSFVHASVSDPGILPRNIQRMPPPEENEDPLRLAPSTTDWVVVKSGASENAAMEMPVKYCKTCNLWRPPRGHHCRICDNCIENLDHHCVWLNNCVGARNYRYFFTFVFSGTLMAMYLCAASLTQILLYMIREDVSFIDSIDVFRVPFAMVIYAVLASVYPIALTGYHLYLMSRGETTREYIHSQKFIPTERHRAFTQGNVLLNWIVVLCRPRAPNYIDFKKKFEVGDQRFGEKRSRKVHEAEVERKRDVEMQKLSPGIKQQGFQGPKTLR